MNVGGWEDRQMENILYKNKLDFFTKEIRGALGYCESKHCLNLYHRVYYIMGIELLPSR